MPETDTFRSFSHTRQDISKTAIEGGLQSGAYALVGSTLVSGLASALFPSYRTLLPLPGKIFLISMVSAGSAMMGAEGALSQSTRIHKQLLLTKDSEQRVSSETSPMFKNRFAIASGVMAAGLTGGLVYVLGRASAKYRTAGEKMMSVRLFTHSVGLATLVGLVGLASVYAKTDDQGDDQS